MSNYIDIEDALQAMLNADTTITASACAKPLPASFVMPHIVVDELNAYDVNRAQAVYNVVFTIRAAEYAQAAQLACELGDWVRGLEGATIGGKPCYQVDALTKQRVEPDASHESALLAKVSASLWLRVAD